MLKTILKLSLVSVLVLVSQACTTGAATPDPNSINTAIAQTLLAQTPLPGIPITGPSSTPTLPMTPTQALSATPLLSPTAVVAVPQVSVSVSTNCRTGPGTAYGRLGGLAVGQVAQVVGRNADGTYWVIQNPDRAGQTCWLWSQFAVVAGNVSALPVFTPPPLPTPSLTPVPSATAIPSITPTSAAGFIASYSGLENCTGTGWWVDIELKNSGAVALQSMALIATDTVTSTVLPLYADSFMNKEGCSGSDTRPNLPAGGILTVSSPVFSSDPTGHQLRVVITLCSNPGQSGMCATQPLTFTP